MAWPSMNPQFRQMAPLRASPSMSSTVRWNQKCASRGSGVRAAPSALPAFGVSGVGLCPSGRRGAHSSSLGRRTAVTQAGLLPSPGPDAQRGTASGRGHQGPSRLLIPFFATSSLAPPPAFAPPLGLPWWAGPSPFAGTWRLPGPPAQVARPSAPQASASAAPAGTPSRAPATSTLPHEGAGRRQRPSAGCTARTWPASARPRSRTSSTVGWGRAGGDPGRLLSPTLTH